MLKSITILLAIVGFGSSQKYEINTEQFPTDFTFGAGSSAYQIEGAWNEDGKGVNIWDHYTRTKPILDDSNGDIACDSYHKLDEDIEILKQLGVGHYSFSLSWSRILPSGFENKINQAGIDYYNRLIDKLLKNNIQPMVTIYHRDLPQALQNLGGFTNPLIIRWFEEYARIAFKAFGDRVKFWITFNDPKKICAEGYGYGKSAPGVNLDGIADYICSHHLIQAHARVYHLYKNIFHSIQKGSLGIAIECGWHEPSWGGGSIESSERKNQFDCGLYANPIYSKNGDYPQVVKEFVANRSKLEGFPNSRLPSFTPEQIKYIQGTYDYFGLSHYTTFTVVDKQMPEPIGEPSLQKDISVIMYQNNNWPSGEFYPFKIVPWGFRKILKWIKDTYDDPVIYVTENGLPDKKSFNDSARVDYLELYLSNLLDSIFEDGVRVKRYTFWSLMDAFEWYYGYDASFGLYQVNFTDPKRTREPRNSAILYAEIIKNRRLTPSN